MEPTNRNAMNEMELDENAMEAYCGGASRTIVHTCPTIPTLPYRLAGILAAKLVKAIKGKH